MFCVWFLAVVETEVFGHVKCHRRLEKEAGIVQYEGGNRTVKTPEDLKMLRQGLGHENA